MDRYQYQLPPIYFLHIPKTAGTSLKYWLNDFYGHHEQLSVGTFEELHLVTREQINQASLIAGHFRWKMFELLDTPRLSITWLRDPVKRAISNYLFNRQQFPLLVAQAESLGHSDWIEYYQECQKRTLSELIDNGMYVGYLDNVQIRHLADCFADDQPRYVDDSVFELAKENLETLSFVGLCEWMDQSIDLCCYKLGFPYHPLRMSLNTTTVMEKFEPDSDELNKLEYAERFDRKLYEYARQRFEQQFIEFWTQVSNASVALIKFHDQAEPSKFLSEVKKHYNNPTTEQAISGCVNRNFACMYPDVPRVDEAELNFEDAVFLNNWHPRWMGDKPGSIIRWAGPGNRSTILLPLKPQLDYEVAFVVENHANPQFIDSMSISANGHPLITKTKFLNRMALVWFLIPREAIREHEPMTEIAIQVSGEILPSSIDGGLRVSFCASRFWFRVSARNGSLVHSWLSDFELSGKLPNAPAKSPVIPGFPSFFTTGVVNPVSASGR